MNKTVYWAYNETFKYYHDLPLAGKRAQAFVDRRNQEKGGRWVLHTPEQYDVWYRAVGQHKESLAWNNLGFPTVKLPFISR